MKKEMRIGRILIYIILGIGAVLCFFPFYWMLRTSVVTSSYIFSTDIQLLPPVLKLDNFKRALTSQPFGKYFLNSICVTITGGFGAVLSSSLCAYGFSRIDWPGRDKIFGLLMTALMLPTAVLIIPHFIGWSYLKLTDTFVPLVLPAYFGGGLFNIFLLRQFYMGIPKELDEAAYIDGASTFKIYSSIILPLSKQSLIVVGLFTYLSNWNMFLEPMIYINSEKKFTLMLGLNQFIGSYAAEWNLMMAATTVVIVPSILIYLFAQKYFIEGIVMTGLKS
ncbi:MAG: carbohydrate ABC transporter permease [Clostridiaceae bacterium]|nr:carbohydrate ABC transporter permease [Clostridiaceae bacterium]